MKAVFLFRANIQIEEEKGAFDPPQLRAAGNVTLITKGCLCCAMGLAS